MDGSLDLSHVAELVVVAQRAAPCAVVAAAIRKNGAWWLGLGAHGVDVETPFDLASLTKPVTALAMARLTRTRALRREEPLAAFLPTTLATPSASLPLDLFAAHRAGLEA